MLHHYNYASPLSHFLSYHQLQEQNECSNGQTTPNSVCDDLGQQIVGESRGFKSVNGTANGKSFTIAAILGLKPDAVGNNDIQTGPTDLTVVNLSVHQGLSDRNLGSHVSDCSSRLQLPVRGGHASSGVGGGGPGGGGSMSSVPYPTVAAGTCQQQRTTVRGLKHMNSTGSSSHKKSSSSKSKRVRTIFTPEQLERLEGEFERQQYMVGPERLYLAHTLQLTEAQVKVWFQNRRIKWRKHHLEITHQRLAAIKQQQIQHHLLGETNTDTLDSNNSSGTDT